LSLPFGLLFLYADIMAKSITAHKKRGRPATGFDPTVSIRVPQYFIDETEAFAKRAKISRAEAFRKLLEMGLDAIGAKPKAKR
jgi:hypothetical protein